MLQSCFFHRQHDSLWTTALDSKKADTSKSYPDSGRFSALPKCHNLFLRSAPHGAGPASPRARHLHHAAWMEDHRRLSGIVPNRFDDLLRDWVARAKRREAYDRSKRQHGLARTNAMQPDPAIWQRS
jgi:hypothetical protein